MLTAEEETEIYLKLLLEYGKMTFLVYTIL